MELNGEGIIEHGPVDTRALMKELPPLETEFWMKKDQARQTLAATRDGNSVFLQAFFTASERVRYEDVHRFLSDTGRMHVYRDPAHSKFWDIIDRDILPTIKDKYPGATPMVVQLATLPAGGWIKPHCDLNLLKDVHRLHVPLITNSSVSFFVDGLDGPQFLAPDHLYELDNTVTHSVENRSDQERLHLLIDLLPPELGGVSVHTDEESFAVATRRFRSNLGVTMLCRGAGRDQDHGYVLSLNALARQINVQKALTGPVSGTNPRGGGRGYRGLAQSKDYKRVFVADYEKINVFSNVMEPVAEPITHPAMAHIHALFHDDETLWAVSTANDTVFGFSAENGEFKGAWEFGVNEESKIITEWVTDPQRPVDRPGESRFHLNAVTCHKGMIYVGGLRTSGIFRLNREGEVTHLPGPAGSHDIVVVREKLISLDTAARKIRVTDLDGKLIRNVDLPERVYAGNGVVRQRRIRPELARRGYLRGICPGSGSYVYVGFSPAAIIRFDTELGTFDNYRPLSDDPRWMIAGLCQIVEEQTG